MIDNGQDGGWDDDGSNERELKGYESSYARISKTMVVKRNTHDESTRLARGMKRKGSHDHEVRRDESKQQATLLLTCVAPSITINSATTTQHRSYLS